MKKSEIIKDKLYNEDNDLRALGIGKQLIREERSERFEDIWLPKLKDKFNVIFYPKMGKYIIQKNSIEIYHYFPKANKLLIQHKNKWVKQALKWIIEDCKLLNKQ